MQQGEDRNKGDYPAGGAADPIITGNAAPSFFKKYFQVVASFRKVIMVIEGAGGRSFNLLPISGGSGQFFYLKVIPPGNDRQVQGGRHF